MQQMIGQSVETMKMIFPVLTPLISIAITLDTHRGGYIITTFNRMKMENKRISRFLKPFGLSCPGSTTYFSRHKKKLPEETYLLNAQSLYCTCKKMVTM
jgi:hypothetical protein